MLCSMYLSCKCLISSFAELMSILGWHQKSVFIIVDKQEARRKTIIKKHTLGHTKRALNFENTLNISFTFMPSLIYHATGK